MLADPQAHAIEELTRARKRLAAVVDEVTESHLRRQWIELLSPMVWDIAHIGNYEDLWLVRSLDGSRVADPQLDDLYDAFRQPRDRRSQLPLLGPDAAREYLDEVRTRSLDAIDRGLLDPVRAAGTQQLLRDAFVVGLVVQHEHQHVETILQARQAMGELATAPLGAAAGRTGPTRVTGDPHTTEWRQHPGGNVTIGTSDDPWAYDNERPAHHVELAPFAIARECVTNAQWLAFMEDGGCDHLGEQLHAPSYWERDGNGAWRVLRFGTWIDVDPREPVQHISWHEADAFARWAGARLPTEQEWETAARDALLDDAATGVWQWTSSRFAPWPGFEIFPYAEYSAAFFDGDYRVLRGGSWASDPLVTRPTFRNWDRPQRRQLFAGLRLAHDSGAHA